MFVLIFTRLIIISIITFITFFYFFYFFYYIFIHFYNMQFLFVSIFIEFCYVVRIANKIVRINRVQIFENIFFNNFLHDFNFFIFSISKRVFKRFLNNIMIDINNKSIKTRKKIDRSLRKKKQLHVKSHIILYFSIFSLFFHIVLSQQRKKSRLRSFLFTFFFFFFCFLFFFFFFNKYKKKKKNYKKFFKRFFRTKYCERNWIHVCVTHKNVEIKKQIFWREKISQRIRA